MFISLNKKIIYSIALLFILISMLFIYSFYSIYNIRLEEELHSNILRNQQYMGLLIDNINLKKELKTIADKNPDIKIQEDIKKILQDVNEKHQISQEQKYIEKIVQAYNKRYDAIQQSLKIVLFSGVNIFFLIILLWFLIRHWVIIPLENFSHVNKSVTLGNLSKRVVQSSKFLHDEIDFLASTYNQMLDRLENYIQEIKDKETFLQSLIDSIPDGIRVIDNNYNIVIANKEYYKQAGCSSACIGKKCYESSQKRNTPCPRGLFVCPLEEIKTKKNKKMKVIQRFSSQPDRHLSINAAPLQTPQDEQNNRLVIEVIRDLSDDINFSHQQKMASLAFLSSSIAHEIKNSLGSVRIIMEKIIDKYFQDLPENDEKKNLMQLVYKQIVECTTIPERLLSLTRVQNDKKIEIDCGLCIQDTVNLLDYEAKHNGITLSCEYADNLKIKGNETDFKMIIINMLLNAIKATAGKTGAAISITAQRKNKEITIQIKDNGHGIPPEQINHIFEPFYSEGKNNGHIGTGLGLSIVKSIVTKFGGKIDTESTINEGTIFTLKFPGQVSQQKNKPTRKKILQK